MIFQNERLFPKRYAHNYYILTRIRNTVEEIIRKYIDSNTDKKKLIDYGCGDVPYLPLFADKVAKYVTCDIAGNPCAEVVITPDGKVPLPDDSFDIVLSVQVLEHVDDVAIYLAEANRLLEKDGLLLLSTHGQWIWHPCPKDLRRWTREGLTSVIEKSGFEIIDSMWASGMLAYSSQLRLFFLQRLAREKGIFFKLIFKIMSLTSNFLMPFMDRLEGESGKNNAAVYFIVARKNQSGLISDIGLSNLEPARVEKIETIYGRFNAWKGDMITGQLKEYSAHTRNELAMLKSLIAAGDNIVDIGAHIGTFAIPFARFNKEQGKIFSFEANVDNYNLLKLNINENCLKDVIIPTHAIVSDKKRSFSMSKPKDDNSGMHYFLPDVNQPEMVLSDTDAINIDEWHENNESDTRIDLIKIDIEGAEMAALRSCEKIIKKYLPMMYIEINSEALDRFNCTADDIEDELDSFGYHFFRNTGLRNSDNDTFKIEKLNSVKDGGVFFDLLAVHPSSHRYPAL
jgi:FkbM family methyltransferase